MDNHFKKKDDINVFYEEDEMEWNINQKTPIKEEKVENKDDNVNIPEVVWLVIRNLTNFILCNFLLIFKLSMLKL